jgi:hypothetical protein
VPIGESRATKRLILVKSRVRWELLDPTGLPNTPLVNASLLGETVTTMRPGHEPGAAFLTAPRPSGQQSTARYVLAIRARKINTSFLIWYFFLNTAQDPLITSLRPFLTPRSHAPSRKAAARQRLTRVPAARRLPEWRRGCGKNGGESAARTEADHEVTLVIPRMWSSMRPPPARRSAAPRRS